MSPRDSIEMVKEQLRIQAVELQKRDAEKEKGDAKVKHILKLSQEKIKDLTETVAKKDQEIKYASSETSKSGSGTKDEKSSETDEKLSKEIEKSQKAIKLLKEKLDESKKENTDLSKKLENSSKAETASSQESSTEKKDPKLVKALKRLKLKNQALEEQLEEKGGNTKLEDKEKEMMEQEIKRLRDQPDAQKELKKKVKKLKKENEKAVEKYKKEIKEKTEQIASYEKVLYGKGDEEGEGTKLPSEMIKELKESLAGLQEEKTELEKQLNSFKEDFKKKLEVEIKKLQEEFEDEIANANKQGKGGGGAECEPCDEGAPEWMATFADMVTLLMVFFVLMYAIASKNISTVKSVLAGEETASVGVLELMDAVEVKESISSLTGMQSDDILSKMEEVAEDSSLEVETDAAKIIVRVPGATLFPPGKANLNLSARPVLDEVIRVVNKYPKYKIHIQGHTDDEPISTAMFPTNWELSAGRATAVLRYFVDRGAEPERMTATGYADTFPLARNDIAEGRARNRRVEFVLEKK
ncbi:MAG: OmpA family protein [Nitrospinota bacterium]|nr:OmpA family protein [Nitrospinota bacterium]